MRIAIDAHGGDHAPDAVVEGIRQAKEKWPDLKIILIGLKDMEDQLALDGVEFRPVTEKIEPEDKPTQAVRRKKDSSIVVGCQMVRKKRGRCVYQRGKHRCADGGGFFPRRPVERSRPSRTGSRFSDPQRKRNSRVGCRRKPGGQTGAFKAVCDDGKHLCRKGVGF